MSKKERQPDEIRSVYDDIRDQHKKMKDMSFKERIGYFWYYYKYHTLGAIGVTAFLISMIVTIATNKDYSFYGIMLNSADLSEEAIESSFIEYAGLNEKEYDCFIDTDSTMSNRNETEFDIATTQRMVALMQTKDLDAVVIDSEIYNNYANNDMMMDLRTILSADELKQYEGYLYYVDNAEIQAAFENSDYENPNLLTDEETADFTMEDILAEAETHRHPENMKDPMPVGIFMEESPFAVKSGAYSEFVPVFGISITSQRAQTAITYLHFLWDDNIAFDNMHREF